MTETWKSRLTRRPFVTGLLGLAGLGLLGILGLELPPLFKPRYAPTPFDDLLGRLPDRDNAARLGAAFLASEKNFDAVSAAGVLRSRIGSANLADVVADDVRRDHLAEVHGWVLPVTLARLCALAARLSQTNA